MAHRKKRGRSAAFMRSINPFLKKRKINKRGSLRFHMAKKRHSRRRSSGIRLGVLGAVIGAVGYIVFDAIVKPFLPLNALVLSVAELGVGFWLSTSRNQMLKNIGLAAIFINLFAIGKSIILPTLGGLIPSITA